MRLPGDSGAVCLRPATCTRNRENRVFRMESLPERILVIGARGLLGTPTCRLVRGHARVALDAADLPELDITRPEQVRERVQRFRPVLVINCAAYTAVDACEVNEEAATRVNAVGAGHVARAAAEANAGLIHISTDYVFFGTAASPYREDHPTGPPERLSAYGRSKLLGEREVRDAHPGAVIVRTAWLYGPDGPGFPQAILHKARQEGALRVVNDQRGSPTYAPDLAAALLSLGGRSDAAGVFHVTNSGECTWYEFAVELVRLAGLDVPITPVTTAEFPRPARRPSFSVLDNRRYAEFTGCPLRPWREAAAEFMRGHAAALMTPGS